MALLGVHNGNDPKAVLHFEDWLGRRIDFHSQFLNEDSWDAFDRSVDWALGHYPDLPRPIVWSVPLIAKDANLGEAAHGTYNRHYRIAAQKIEATRSEPILYVRTGWEFNGNWMKWSSGGREANFIAAFRNLSACFRTQSDRFAIVWCPNIGQRDPAPSYPGDEYVDVIGLDFYYQPRWDPAGSAEDIWTYMVTRPFGLQWHLEFSRKHNKPIAFPEWGVCADHLGPYIARAAAWFAASDVIYHSYWDSNADYPGRLSDGSYPETGAAFKKAFG
jgi:beta-mannanase